MTPKETAAEMKRDKDAGENVLAGLVLFVVFLVLAGMTGCVYQIWTW